jgi:hypothetical protein
MIRLFSTWWKTRRRRPHGSLDRGLLFRHRLRNERLEDRWVLAVITVDTLLDESDGSIDDGDVSLRDALAVAASGDTIDFDASLDGGTILLTQGELLVPQSLTIDASDLSAGLTIDAAGSDPTPDQNNGDGSRIFNISDGADHTDSPVTISGLTLTGGDVEGSGGAIHSSEGLTINESTVSGNSCGWSGSGGGVYARGAVAVTSSTISGNDARYQSSGGGIRGGAVMVTNSTVSGNYAYSGGGISAGDVTITNSTISGNRSYWSSGGISGHTVTITNSTISENEAYWPFPFGDGGHGGGIVGRTISIENSIVARNVASGAAPDVDAREAASFAARFSLIGDNTGTGLAEAQTPDENGNLIGDPNGEGVIDSLLGPLTENGGPTRTQALLVGSPAINAGDPDFSVPPEFDQRGELYPRVVDARIDMGAHERQNLTVDILDVTSPTMTAVEEVTIRFSRENTGFDITDLELSWNGGGNLLTAAQVITTTDGQSFSLSGLSSLTGTSGYYKLTLIASDTDIVDAGGGPLDSGDSIGWAMGRPELRITVDTLLDEADGLIDDGDVSLRDAIAASAPNEIIDFDAALDGGTILLTLGDLKIAKSLTIDATALPIGLTIDASSNDPTPGEDNGDGSRVFTIDDGTPTADSEVTITGLTLTGGDVNDGGGAIRSLESLTVINSSVSGNSVAWLFGGIGSGGGIDADTLTVTNSTISGNSAYRYGGGISASTLTVTNSTISGNRAGDGGGGGIHADDVTVINSTISGNRAGDGGGGSGGGIDARDTVTVANSTISGNSAYTFGGGIRADTVTVTNSTISGNTSLDTGGGIDARDTVTVANSTISGNSGNHYGGGIRADTVTVTNSTISASWARYGGGIYADAVAVTNSTISGNRALVGGGIRADTVTVTNSTISGNSTYGGPGGGIYARGALAVINIANSIVARNIVGGAAPDIDARDVASFAARFSLIGDNTGTPLAEAQTPDESGNLVGDPNGGGVIDPLLGPLADNGGPTHTHALLPGSPAINAGDPDFSGPPDHDQRGMSYVRVSEGHIDMGAFETQPARAGDFDGNAVADIDDVDMLVAEIAAGAASQLFDLTGDGEVNSLDLDEWLTVAAEQNGFSEAFLSGDSNLDGLVDSQDLNNLAMNWQQSVGFWSRGDFNADGIVNAHDLNELAMNWQQSIPLAAASGAVPHPLTVAVALADFDTWHDRKLSATAACCVADFNADGVTNGFDFNLWNRNRFAVAAGGLCRRRFAMSVAGASCPSAAAGSPRHERAFQTGGGMAAAVSRESSDRFFDVDIVDEVRGKPRGFLATERLLQR